MKNPRPQKACECRTEGRGESPYWYVYEHNLWPSREDALSISAVVFDRDGVLTSFDWTRAEEDVRRITGLPLEEIERRWGGWLNGLTIDDAFVETQPISEFLSSLARELELGSKARDELVRLDYMAFAQGYPDARPALKKPGAVASRSVFSQTTACWSAPAASFSAPLCTTSSTSC